MRKMRKKRIKDLSYVNDLLAESKRLHIFRKGTELKDNSISTFINGLYGIIHKREIVFGKENIDGLKYLNEGINVSTATFNYMHRRNYLNLDKNIKFYNGKNSKVFKKVKI